MNMRIWAVVYLSMFLTASTCCEHETIIPVCDVSEPTTQLVWLKEKIEAIQTSSIRKYMYVVQAEYEGKPVFYISNCCPFCLSTPPTVYDCEGNELFQLSGARQVTNTRVIWKPIDFPCHD